MSTPCPRIAPLFLALLLGSTGGARAARPARIRGNRRHLAAILRDGFARSRIALLRLTLTLLVFGTFAAGASGQVTLNPNVLNVYRNSPAINLTQAIAANPPGGTYSGPGVTNTVSG